MTPDVCAEALGQTDEKFVERADLIDQMEAPDLAHVGGLTIPEALRVAGELQDGRVPGPHPPLGPRASSPVPRGAPRRPRPEGLRGLPARVLRARNDVPGTRREPRSRETMY